MYHGLRLYYSPLVFHGSTPVSVGMNTVEPVDEFIYLGSKVTTEGHCTPEVTRRIALAAAALNSPSRVWREKHLHYSTKLRIYESCVLSVLLYCCETWTLLRADVD